MSRLLPTPRTAVWLALLVGLLMPAVAYAQKMYFTAGRSIYRASLDGTDLERLANFSTGPAPGCPKGIALDLTGKKMYWADNCLRMLRRANLDGTSVEDILVTSSGGWRPASVALDMVHGKLYWIEEGFPRADTHASLSGCIWRANLDGTTAERLVDGVCLEGIALDPDAGKMYWTHFGEVIRGNLDGSEGERFIGSSGDFRAGPYLDLAEGQAYFVASGHNSEYFFSRTEESRPRIIVQRARIKDSPRSRAKRAIENIASVESPYYGGGIALDTANRRVYWTSIANDSSPSHYDARIQCTQLDDHRVQDVLYTWSLFGGIALDLTPAPPSRVAPFLVPLLAGVALLGLLGVVMTRRPRAWWRRSTTQAAPCRIDKAISTSPMRAGLTRMTKWACCCLAGLTLVSWGLSTCVQACYSGWGYEVSWGSGQVAYSRETWPLPGYMKGRFVFRSDIPMIGWHVDAPAWSGWKAAMEGRSWTKLSNLLGLAFPKIANTTGSRGFGAARQYIMPLWIPVLLFSMPAVVLFRRDRRRRPPGHCRSCGYNLTGNTSGICPECGTAVAEETQEALLKATDKPESS